MLAASRVRKGTGWLTPMEPVPLRTRLWNKDGEYFPATGYLKPAAFSPRPWLLDKRALGRALPLRKT
jgi:hypothetical protein